RHGPRDERVDRAGDRVDGTGPCLLHQRSAGLLRDDDRDRDLRDRAGRTQPGPAGACGGARPRGGGAGSARARPGGGRLGGSGGCGDALLAGSCIAVASGLIGWFLVLRGQVFAGDALSHVAFTGALAAAAAGLDLRAGLFAATVAVALLLAALGERARADDVT